MLEVKSTLRDQTLRCCVDGVAHEVEDEPVVEVLRQVLGHVVGDVFFRRDVHEIELVLANSVPDPMESHVDCLAAFHFDDVVC